MASASATEFRVAGVRRSVGREELPSIFRSCHDCGTALLVRVPADGGELEIECPGRRRGKGRECAATWVVHRSGRIVRSLDRRGRPSVGEDADSLFYAAAFSRQVASRKAER